MNIDDFEYLKDNCSMKSYDGEHILFQPIKPRAAQKVLKIVKDNRLENISMEDVGKILQKYYPIYQSRKKLKEHQFSSMSAEEVASLPIEKKLDYMESLFYASQTVEDTVNVCKRNEENIRACLFGMDFPQSFWINEKKLADRYVNLITGQPEIIDKLKNWQQTSLNDKKFLIEQSGKVFKHIYGIKPDIVYFTTEEERAKNRAMGLPENSHIYAAYQKDGKIHFNVERLQSSDNFFAISVLFHEGTHLRQHLQTFKDSVVNRIFNCSLDNITAGENIVFNDKEALSYKDLYTMQPSETHAYGLQEYVEQQITEKTGIEKTQHQELDKETKKIHDKAFSMAKLAQYRALHKKVKS